MLFWGGEWVVYLKGRIINAELKNNVTPLGKAKKAGRSIPERFPLNGKNLIITITVIIRYFSIGVTRLEKVVYN